VGLCVSSVEDTFRHAIQATVIPAQAGIQRARLGAPKRIFFPRIPRGTGYRLSCLRRSEAASASRRQAPVEGFGWQSAASGSNEVHGIDRVVYDIAS
jgi:hypothetical protein